MFSIVSYNFSNPFSSFVENSIMFFLVSKILSLSFIIFLFKSVLFIRIIAFLFFIKSSIFSSSLSNVRESSNTAIINSASLVMFMLLFTPICSTSSFVFRIPAVSIIFSGIPFTFIYSSMVSLVVPSISLTMALFSPKIIFNKEDFPTFGFPTMAVFIPSFKILPFLKLSSNFFSLSSTLSNVVSIFLFVVSSMSYSG